MNGPPCLARRGGPPALVGQELSLLDQDDRIDVVLILAPTGDRPLLVGVRDDDHRGGQFAERSEEGGSIAVRACPSLERIHDDHGRVTADHGHHLSPKDGLVRGSIGIGADPANAIRRGASPEEERLDLRDVHLAIEPVDGPSERFAHSRSQLGHDRGLADALEAADEDLAADLDAAEHFGQGPAELANVASRGAHERAHRHAGRGRRRRRGLVRLPRIAIDPVLGAARARARGDGRAGSLAPTTSNQRRTHQREE